MFSSYAHKSLVTGEIADLWVELPDAAKTDQEAQAFLSMFEQWAKARTKAAS